MGCRHRRMYYATGMPGWLRFGYSPGWSGQSPPGQPYPSSPGTPWAMGAATMTKEQEKAILDQQAKEIELQISAIKNRLNELRSGSATQQPQHQAYPFMGYPYPPMTFGGSPYDYSSPYDAPLSPEEELASLDSYRHYLDEETKGVQARIDELKKQTTRASPEVDETRKEGGE